MCWVEEVADEAGDGGGEEESIRRGGWDARRYASGGEIWVRGIVREKGR